MAEQLVQQAFGNILPSSDFTLTQALLVSSFFLAVNFPNIAINPPVAESVNTEYDFIVVGAGSGGAVVASRLSENPDFSVLLLEAGGKASKISDIPFYGGVLQLSESDWNYTSEPNSEFCLGMKNRACPYARGRVLGGSSVLNHMFYARGTKEDFDEWAALGNYGWSFDDVLPYYKKSEDNRNYLLAKNAFTFPQMTMRDGFRCSTSKAFLVPAGERENLDVFTHAHVTKVLIDAASKRAYGVRYFRNGAYHDVFARKEVVLSAGVFNSPQLLMLSGIGPKEHLKEIGIPLIQDLRVGFNLQDHFGYFMPFLVDKPVAFVPERYNNHLTNMTYDIYQKGGRICLELMETKAFREVNGRHPYVPLPTCPNVLPLSEEYFDCFMRYNTQPFLHGSGTSKMGPANDPTAVVDPELRVHGISGLRVADTSIMPKIISGNTNAPAIMIGEKASDLIKKTWEKKEVKGSQEGY
ncbi:Glucose dehydrogenase [FAD, quinone] [Armadillidium nasatum]|uniref:Glucose dehydrogenase [FAD, quinone] n=1 Tax=Armadillidium nasatum TaxID=96803 RepID=A0A5N5TB13_9CRUS|nr:Glucose dehydrogenase [FAD, quinone] [Armadillidium nasatum]